MACTIPDIQADACESCIGKVTDEVMLLQITAQVSATQLLTVSPDSDVSVAAVLARACSGGIGKVQDETTLLQVIAEIGCESADGEACSLSETLAGACASGVGEFDSEIQLLRLWAQIYCAEETVVAPSAPVADDAVDVSASSMTVSWSDPSGTATSFRLDVSTDPLFGSFFGVWNDLDVGFTFSSVITGLSTNTPYYFRVRAVNTAGTSSNSNVFEFFIITPPSTISQLEIWARSDSGVYQDAAKTTPCTDGTTVYTWDNMGNTALTADFVQATGGLRPTYNASGGVNGLPRISFNSGMMRLVSGSFSQAFTVIVVGKYTSNAGGYAAWFWDDSSGVQVTTTTAQADRAYLTAGSIAQGTVALGGAVGYFVGIFSGGSSALYTNGISNLPGSPGTNGIGTAVTIGGYSAGAGYYLIGDEYEVMLFSKALTAAELATIHEYLYLRYRYSLSWDTFSSDTAGDDLSGLYGGINWDAAYVSRTSFHVCSDTFESYAAADPLDGLNAGTNWNAAYVSRS